MNPNMCETRQVGIEWEFTDGQPELVAHIPSANGGDWELWNVLNDAAELGRLSPLQRAILRAYLSTATQRLDATEPSDATAVTR